jgi:hypothetical protein
MLRFLSGGTASDRLLAMPIQDPSKQYVKPGAFVIEDSDLNVLLVSSARFQVKVVLNAAASALKDITARGEALLLVNVAGLICTVLDDLELPLLLTLVIILLKMSRK